MKNSNSNLNPKKSESTDISKPWDKDNQAWWDWYVSLADNDSKEQEIININPLPNIQIQQLMTPRLTNLNNCLCT